MFGKYFSKMKITKFLSIAKFKYLLALTVFCQTASAQIGDDETNDVHELPAIGKYIFKYI